VSIDLVGYDHRRQGWVYSGGFFAPKECSLSSSVPPTKWRALLSFGCQIKRTLMQIRYDMDEQALEPESITCPHGGGATIKFMRMPICTCEDCLIALTHAIHAMS